MLGWLRKLFHNVQARSAALEKLEQQAHAAKEQLNHALVLAHTSNDPVTKVSSLVLAKTKFAELQAIAAEHPKMRVTNAQEVEEAIHWLDEELQRMDYYAIADARRRQSASAHLHISQRAKDLLQ